MDIASLVVGDKRARSGIAAELSPLLTIRFGTKILNRKTNEIDYLSRLGSTNTQMVLYGLLDFFYAHRISPKLLRNRRLNLFAIRVSPVHKSALPLVLTQKESVIILNLMRLHQWMRRMKNAFNNRNRLRWN